MTQQFLAGCLFFWDFNSEITTVSNINHLNVMKLFQPQIMVPVHQDSNYPEQTPFLMWKCVTEKPNNLKSYIKQVCVNISRILLEVRGL